MSPMQIIIFVRPAGIFHIFKDLKGIQTQNTFTTSRAELFVRTLYLRHVPVREVLQSNPNRLWHSASDAISGCSLLFFLIPSMIWLHRGSLG